MQRRGRETRAEPGRAASKRGNMIPEGHGMERYRIRDDWPVYFVTFSVVEWLPVFVSEATCRIVTNSLTFCHRNKGLRINAWVIMPTHLHAIVAAADGRGQQLARTITDFRKFTGRQLSDYCDRNMPACFGATFREAAGDDRQRQFWQSSRHPVTIETERFWRQKFDYLHENPCRKGLVRRAADWRFSSAAYYLSDGEVASEVPLTWLEW